MSLFYAGWSWSRARPLCVLPASQWSKRWFTLLLQPLLCLCLSLPVSPADIDLFAKQGDRQCFQLFQTLCFPFHLYLGKALTPHVAAMCVAFCTWTSPAQSPVCMCVSVRVCLSWKVDVHVDAMCLRVSDPVPNQLCLLSWTGACSSLQIHPDVQQFI